MSATMLRYKARLKGVFEMEMKAVKFVETTSDKMHLFETRTGKPIEVTDYDLNRFLESRGGNGARGKYAFRELSDMENSFSKGVDEKSWMNEFIKEHSTLQQNEVRLFVKMLEHLAELYEYDDRRKASIRLAKRVLQVMKDEDIALPYI